MKYQIGIDEVGRGCLAGPVFVCAALLPKNFRPSRKLGPLKDSKQLTETQREAWFEYLSTHPKIKFALGRVHPRMIEKINISNAANLGAHLAVRRLVKEAGCVLEEADIYLDGGLYIKKKGKVPHAKTVVKADEKFIAVRIASILAKVARDAFMVRLAKKYPAYDFGGNKGYATRAHREALENKGPESVHRLTFIANYAKIQRIESI